MNWRTDKAPKDGHPIMAEFKGPGMAIAFYGSCWNPGDNPTKYDYEKHMQIWRNWFDPEKIYTQEPERWLPVFSDGKGDPLDLLRAAKRCGLETQYRDCLRGRGYLNIAYQRLPDEDNVIPLRTDDAPEEYRVVPQPDGSVECWDDYNKTVQKVILPKDAETLMVAVTPEEKALLEAFRAYLRASHK